MKYSYTYFILFILIFTRFSLSAQVGIGVPNPTEQLDVSGNIKFTGEIKPSGVSGNSGKVLTAKGVGNPTVWLSATNEIHSNSYQVFATTDVIISNTGAWTVLPGLTQSVTLTGPAKVFISSNGGLSVDSSSNNGYTTIHVALFQDGNFLANGAYRQLTALNGSQNDYATESWAFSVLIDIPAAGTYVWDIRSVKIGGSNAYVSGDNNNVNQGSLSIVVLYE